LILLYELGEIRHKEALDHIRTGEAESLIHNIVPKKPSEPHIHFLSKPGQDKPNLSKPGQRITETPEQPYIVTTFLNKLSEQQGNDEE
jgi:hypothetical protein